MRYASIIVAACECLTEITMSGKSSSSRIRTSESADSTSASGDLVPNFASTSLSSDPAFTPTRIGTPRAFASRAISRSRSWCLMFPGLIRSPWTPPSRAAIAYFHWKCTSATTGTVECSAIAFSASASSQCGTATRTMSTPAATTEAICCRVALTSEVLVVVIVCTEIGASPPISTDPRRTFRDGRRFASIDPGPRSLTEDVERHLTLLGLVHLEQDQPLPPPEHRLAGRDRDGVRGRRQQHRLDVRVSVRALVGLVEVLRPATHVVVGVVDALRNELLHARAEVLQGAVLPLVDEERRRRVLAERDRGAVGHPRVLDRALELLGEIQVGVALHSRDLDRRGPGLHEALLVSAAAATGRSNVNTLPFPTSLSARIRPPWASTTDLAIARPIPVPPSRCDRDG